METVYAKTLKTLTKRVQSEKFLSELNELQGKSKEKFSVADIVEIIADYEEKAKKLRKLCGGDKSAEYALIMQISSWWGKVRASRGYWGNYEKTFFCVDIRYDDGYELQVSKYSANPGERVYREDLYVNEEYSDVVHGRLDDLVEATL